MERTRGRPVPAGRIAPRAAAAFGAVLAAGGIAWLALATRPAAAAVAVLTLLVYLAVYTPLKVRSSVNTLVGAIPGALPPLIGWAAAGAPLDGRAALLFGVLFLWQIPHFLAIAWIYREDYRRAGLVMLTRLDDDGAAAGRHALRYAVATGLLSLAAPAAGLAWGGYLAGAAIAGVLYAAAAAAFALRRSDARARLLLRASLLYLPAFYALLVAHAR
jgi:protoheme IX farnesyltransferase